MAMSTDSDLQEYVPDILSFGINAFTDEHAKAQADIERRLRIEWWERYKNRDYRDISRLVPEEMDATKLTESQFTRCAVYRVLSEYALPKLTRFNPEGQEDRFQVMIKHYNEKFEKEFQQILFDGVEYDDDGDSVIQNDEKEAIHSLRLVR